MFDSNLEKALFKISAAQKSCDTGAQLNQLQNGQSVDRAITVPISSPQPNNIAAIKKPIPAKENPAPISGKKVQAPPPVPQRINYNMQFKSFLTNNLTQQFNQSDLEIWYKDNPHDFDIVSDINDLKKGICYPLTIKWLTHIKKSLDNKEDLAVKIKDIFGNSEERKILKELNNIYYHDNNLDNDTKHLLKYLEQYNIICVSDFIAASDIVSLVQDDLDVLESKLIKYQMVSITLANLDDRCFHSLAIYTDREKNTYQIFDPNIGIFTFYDIKQALNCLVCLNKIKYNKYLDIAFEFYMLK